MFDKSPVKPSGLEPVFTGGFFIIDSVFLVVIGLFDFLLLPDLVLVDCMFLRIFPFLLGCPICWHIVTHSSPL